MFHLVGSPLPGAACRFETASPSQEFPFGIYPLTQPLPAPEDRFVRNLCIGLATFDRTCRNQQSVRMIGQFRNQLPLVFRKFGTQRPPTRWLTIRAHRRQLECEKPLQSLLCARPVVDERVSALSQDPAEFDCCCRQPQLAIAAIDHLGPHVVQQIRQERQFCRILGRFICGSTGDIRSQPPRLEPCAQECGGAADDFSQISLSQGRHIDFLVHAEQRLVPLQLTEKIGPQTHEGEKAGIS